MRSHTHDLEALLKLIQVTDDADERATLITACKSRCVAIRALLDTTKTERRGVLWDPEVDA